MNYDEAIQYIHSVNWTFCKPGLSRTEELCKKIGNPQNDLKFIHVAGTNGKGSFCSMLSEILIQAGYKVGLYTSPYIIEFNERMRVNGENISNESLAQITEFVKQYADGMKDKPTEFELITAIAFEFFKRSGVDIVILEAGMGGRLDSTNIIETSVLSVITGIALDHTAFLGDTVEKIAKEKAGIVKNGIPLLFGGVSETAERVIRDACIKNNSKFIKTDYEKLNAISYNLDSTTFDYKSYSELKIKLLGTYQPRNCATVLEAISALKDLGYDISDGAVRRGLLSARWPARFEIISKKPLIIFDGAHNPEGIESAVQSIKMYFKNERVYAISGVLADKDYNLIAKELSRVVKKAYTITPKNDRALKAGEYAKALSGYGVDAIPTNSIDEAIELAINDAKINSSAIVCLGSLYTYGEVIKAIKIKGER